MELPKKKVLKTEEERVAEKEQAMAKDDPELALLTSKCNFTCRDKQEVQLRSVQYQVHDVADK